MALNTALDAYQAFAQIEDSDRHQRLLGNLRTVLRRYVLPYYGINAKGRSGQLEEALAQLPIPLLINDANWFLQRLENPTSPDEQTGTLSPGAIATYRATLLQFLEWLYGQQPKPDFPQEPSPAKTHLAEHTRSPQLSTGDTLAKARQHPDAKRPQPYALSPEALPAPLKTELAALKHHLQETTGLSSLTVEAYHHNYLCYLGWLTHIQQQRLMALNLAKLTEATTFQAFLQWGECDRGNSLAWADSMATSISGLQQWLTKQTDNSDQPQDELQTVIEDVRSRYRTERNTGAKSPAKASLSFDESVQVVHYLRQCCAPQHLSGSQRSDLALLKSWQRYLMVALLLYCPLRQRDLLRLAWQQNLRWEDDHYQFYLQGGSSTFSLPTLLTSDMRAWQTQWRSQVPTEHDLVFIRTGSGRTPEQLGEPLKPRDVSDLVARAVYKASSVLFREGKRAIAQNFRQNSLEHMAQTLQPPPTANQLPPLVAALTPTPATGTPTSAKLLTSALAQNRHPLELPPSIRAIAEAANPSDRPRTPLEAHLQSIWLAAQSGDYPSNDQ